MVPVTALHHCLTFPCYSGEVLVFAAYGYPSSRTYPFTYRSYPREGTWSAVGESVDCEDLARIAGERVCANATVDCAGVNVVYSTQVVLTRTARLLRGGCTSVAGRPVLWCLLIAVNTV
jgi:hypothetical protein